MGTSLLLFPHTQCSVLPVIDHSVISIKYTICNSDDSIDTMRNAFCFAFVLLLATMAPAVSTGPNYLMFVAASCPCSKIVGESRFLLPNCTSNTTKALYVYTAAISKKPASCTLLLWAVVHDM